LIRWGKTTLDKFGLLSSCTHIPLFKYKPMLL
jgi:hypothetical protein